MADGSINIDLLLNDQTDQTWNNFKTKAEKEGKSGYEKFKDAFKGDPLVTKLEAQADKSGINDFRELLNQLPKEKQTELFAKAEKGEAIDFQQFIRDIPNAKKIMLEAQAKRAGIDNFEELLKKLPKKLPKKTLTDLQTRAEKGEVINFEKELRKLPSKVVANVELNDNASTGLRSLKKQANEVRDKFHRLKDIMIGTFAANALMGGINAITSGIKDMTKAGMEYNKEQDTMKTVWTALTTEAPKDGKELVDYINNLSQHSIYAADNINEMAQSFYHVHSNVEETKKWTDAFVALGSTLHMTGPQISESGEMFAKIVAGGKASAEDMAVMINRFPMFGEALQKATGKSMKELYAMSAAGKLSATQFTEALDYLGEKYKGGTAEAMTSMQGMSMYLKSRLSVLSGEVMKSSFNMSKSATSALQKITSDKSMQKFADGISGALSVALSGISKVITYVSAHSKDIIGIIGNIKQIAGLLIGGAWDIAKDTINGIATAFGLISGNSKKAHDPLKTLNNVLTEIAKHKAMIEALGAAIAAAFVVKKLSDFVGGITTVIKNLRLVTIAQNIFNAAMEANPIGIIIVALAAVGAAFYELYKHNKKFRRFINGLVSSTASFFKGVSKWFGKVWGAVKSVVGKVVNIFKKDWKELLLLIVNPFSGAFALVYKHNKTFRNAINSLVKSVVGFFKGMWNAITKGTSQTFGGIVKSTQNFGKSVLKLASNIWNGITDGVEDLFKWWKKTWSKIGDFLTDLWDDTKKYVLKVADKLWDGITDGISDLFKWWRKTWNKISDFLNDLWGDMKKSVLKTADRLWDGISDGVSSFYNWFKKTWNRLKDFFGDTWNSIRSIGSKGINGLKNNLGNVLGKIGQGFSNTWKGVKDGFSKLWDGMKSMASAGINLVIKPINWGISGINGLIHDFGGSKSAISSIPKVNFATGTGALGGGRRPITRPTFAVLNDGNDSPETGNQEIVIHPNGKPELIQGRNTQRMLAPGTEVLNASESAMFMAMQGAVPFANGTGFWGSLWNGVKSAGSAAANVAGDVWSGAKNIASSAWSGMKAGVDKFTKMFKFITNAVAHPIKTLESIFNPSSKGIPGVFSSIGSGMFKKSKNQAKDWWSELWSMAQDAGESSNGSAKGNDYPWNSKGKDSGTDPWGYFYRECVSFVASRLKNMGVSPSLFSHLGNGSDWVSAKVKHTKSPKAGDVAVYAAGSQFGNHVAMVNGVSGGKISGEDMNWDNDGKYHTYSGRPISGVTTFLDFGGSSSSSDDDKKETKANGPLQKLIQSQVGGMFKWIKKYIAPLNDDEGSGGKAGDVQSWSNDVKKALAKNGLSTSTSMVKKVLRQINTESSGNEKAVQGIHDINSGGNEARGLMQTIPSTFNAYKFPGHGNIMNGYDNLLAALAYAKARYGSNLSALGNGHGYANGGKTNGIGIVGEIQGEDEWVTNPHRSTADETIIGSIKDTAQKQPNSFAAKLSKIVNSAKSGMQNVVAPQPIIAGGNFVGANGNGIDLSGDVNLTIKMDSGEIAHATYPKIKMLQNQEIQLEGQKTGNTYGY